MKTPYIFLSTGLLWLLASCAAPKATIVEEVPEKPVAKKVAVVPKQIDPEPVPQDTGLRLGDDMLTMPDDSQLRSISPESHTGSPVIARPPSE
ncbi:MAG: hypothetical protein ACSHX7_02375 [Luteolibacter sp.]